MSGIRNSLPAKVMSYVMLPCTLPVDYVIAMAWRWELYLALCLRHGIEWASGVLVQQDEAQFISYIKKLFEGRNNVLFVLELSILYSTWHPVEAQ